jgi:thiamine-phosphate diphosphorylase
VHWIADLDSGTSERELLARARELFEAGLPSIQLRGKRRTTAELVAAGTKLREQAAHANAFFVVNADARAARQLAAQGVHFPAGARVLSEIRAERAARGRASALGDLLGGLLYGASCHDARELAAIAGADWAFLSPVFPTRSKPGDTSLGLEVFGQVVAGSRLPVYALGGIDPTNVISCLEAGARGVAAIRGLLEEGGEELVRLALEWEKRARAQAR